MNKAIAILGECMLELSRLSAAKAPQGNAMQMYFGGDTLNTALYMARLGCKVDYVTALGDDHSSYWMKSEWLKEGIGCDLVSHVENSSPGLYMIETDDTGERYFSYWRDNSPATQLFNKEQDATLLFEEISNYSYFLFTGITLSLYPDNGLKRLCDFLPNYKANGGKVIFDGNYRPKRWLSQDVAQQAYEAIYRYCAIALPTYEDEQALFGDTTPEATIARMHSYGIELVVLKMGGDGCIVSQNGKTQLVPSCKVTPIDTTAAGDSFNAGFIHHYINGVSAEDAAVAGHKLASTVIQHRGAILPKAVTGAIQF